MWNNNSWGFSNPTAGSAGTGTSWTMQVQTEDNGDEVETVQDTSMIAGSFDIGDEDESVRPNNNGTPAVISTPKMAVHDTEYYDNDPTKSSLSHQCELGPDGTYICHPYKIELLERQLFTNNPGNTRRIAIIETLRKLGVKVYVIDSASTANSEEVLQHVKRVVGFVATESRTRRNNAPSTSLSSIPVEAATMNSNSFQRCLLYQDGQGRLFNLMLSNHSVGPAARYMEYLTTFSNLEAIIALTILCRSVPCIFNETTIQNLKPAYLSLVLGLVLTEEISLSWLNASMMIRSTPSVSAHTLYSPVGSDTFRRLVLLTLVFAGIAQDIYQSILTAIGILGAGILLLANLGARSWYFLNWKPIRYNGTGSFALAYICAIVTGFMVPFMGHRIIRTGGKSAVEYIIQTAFWVAVAFVISDYDGIQKFLVLGSESELCRQDPVNIVVGIWWTITVFVSLLLVRQMPYHKDDAAISRIGERLLIEDHASPVGYKVPSLPDFEIDPSLANSGLPFVSLTSELIFGLFMVIGIGTVLIGLAFTSWDDDVHETIEGTFVTYI